jgi:hypothetical protein
MKIKSKGMIVMKPSISNLKEWQNLPELNIKKVNSNQETGSIYKVIRVGFVHIQKNNGMVPHPTITILENQKEVFYRLPIELNEWAYNTVAITHSVENPFPSDVEFCNIKGDYSADIL